MALQGLTTPTSSSRSGIRKLDNGESVIPASTRADGSVRKEIRVKAGYRPPEDVEVYKNRAAEGWKNRGKAGVLGAEAVDDASAGIDSASAAKNAKRREARKKAAAAAAEGKSPATNASEPKAAEGASAAAQPSAELDEAAEKAKEARKLAKKLRQARELKDKKDGGGALLPEQIAKVIKINELLRELQRLGFDENGEEKKDD